MSVFPAFVEKMVERDADMLEEEVESFSFHAWAPFEHLKDGTLAAALSQTSDYFEEDYDEYSPFGGGVRITALRHGSGRTLFVYLYSKAGEFLEEEIHQDDLDDDEDFRTCLASVGKYYSWGDEYGESYC